MTSVALAVVVNGDNYHRYAERLFETAKQYFWPCSVTTTS